ncbi:MAG: PQQ-like beta-propeller repeat protein [Myxococcales bacterium]
MLALLLAFSSLPLGHEPRAAAKHGQPDRPFFVGEMTRLIPTSRLPYSPRQTATPVLDDAESRMYLGTYDGMVRCRFRGKTAWSWTAKSSILAAPLLDGESLYVTSADGTLTALNRITGEKRWQLDLREELTTTPTIDEGRLFVMSSEESVTAVDAKTGKSLWKFHRDPPGGFTIRGDARPRVAHGTLFAAFADGTVAALNPADGATKWTRSVSGAGEFLDVDWIEAPEADSRIYVASAKLGTLALDAASGDPVWTVALPGANHVLVDGSRLFAGGRGLLLALDRQTGAELWRLRFAHEKYPTQPVTMNGLLLVAQDRGPLLALDAQSGAPRGAFDPGSGFSMSPLAVPGVAYIVSNDGSLFSLGLLP